MRKILHSRGAQSLLRETEVLLNVHTVWRIMFTQWLKCNRTKGNAVPPPPIYGSKRSPTSDQCYNTRERHTTIVRGPNLNVAFSYLILHFKQWRLVSYVNGWNSMQTQTTLARKRVLRRSKSIKGPICWWKALCRCKRRVTVTLKS